MNRRKFISLLGLAAALPAAKFLGTEIPAAEEQENPADKSIVEAIRFFDRAFAGKGYRLLAETDVLEEARELVRTGRLPRGFDQSIIRFSATNLPLRVNGEGILIAPFEGDPNGKNSSRGLSVAWLNAPYTLVTASTRTGDQAGFAVVRPRFNPAWKNVPDDSDDYIWMHIPDGGIDSVHPILYKRCNYV